MPTRRRPRLTEEQARIARLARHAEKIGRAVDPRLCACGLHLVLAGRDGCWTCLGMTRRPASSAPVITATG
jgi:hypothetical protein